MREPVIEVRGLHKSYGEVNAVRGIDLEVAQPRGVRVPRAQRRREDDHGRDPRGLSASASAGEVTVLGVDPADAGRRWRQRIGIVLQECNLQPELTVRETLELYAGYYEAPRSVAETIELVGLAEQADQRAGRLSGGQQRRLDVALALVGDPELLFLDEPTTGFDPSARRQAWEVIASLRELGKTVFLTTHYMDEAQALADRVAIIVGGEIVAEGPPGELGGRGDAPAPRSASGFRRASAPADLPDEVAVGGRDRTAPERRGRRCSTERPGRDPERAHRLGPRAGSRAGRSRGLVARASRTSTWS